MIPRYPYDTRYEHKLHEIEYRLKWYEAKIREMRIQREIYLRRSRIRNLEKSQVREQYYSHRPT